MQPILSPARAPRPSRLGALLLCSLLGFGCGDDPGDGDGGGGGIDGGGIDGGGVDGGGIDGGGVDGGGVVVLLDGGVLLPDGRVLPAGPITCQGHLYACGDEIDNDGDGLADAADPDCLGPCDNNESGFSLNIPGGDSAPCRLDCYFDQDQGSGNDQCNWDHRCDPLEPDHDALCMYRDPPPASANCPETQATACAEICRPLVPNGCDCFGCCNLPAGGDRWVFIGSVDDGGAPTCTLETMLDDEACHPCTPVANCLNDCGECELCLGRTELPPSCFAPADGGVPPADGGRYPDGGFVPPPDSGTPPPDLCDDGRTSCGLPGLPPCAAGEFCLTGCCTFFG